MSNDSLPDPARSRGVNPGAATPLTVAVQTHGCKLNQADSDQLARRFVEAGYRVVGPGAPADVYVLNTCTVTSTADSKARQALRKAHRSNPGALIVATGCYAQRNADELALVEGVGLVVGNVEKERIPALVSQTLSRDLDGLGIGARQPLPISFPDNNAGESPHTTDKDGLRPPPARNRAMVKIQEGCNQVCAYCIVPKVRGREQSIPPEALVQQINDRCGEGFQEVVLTGTQLGSYGYDIPGMTLSGLLEKILTGTSIPRIRVSSLQAQEITPSLLDLWQDKRLCPHFHVPLQCGSDPVLRAMRRRYTTAEFASTLELVRTRMPDAGITTDVIVGFPGEGEAEFHASREFAERMRFSGMHVFPFSPRPGTSAAYLDDTTPAQVKKERTSQMLEIAGCGALEFRLGQLGSVRQALWESSGRGEGGQTWWGLTDNYIRVKTVSGQDLRNRVTPVKLTALEEDAIIVTVH